MKTQQITECLLTVILERIIKVVRSKKFENFDYSSIFFMQIDDNELCTIIKLENIQ